MKLLTDKRRLAKEWLYFLCFTVPWAIVTIAGGVAFEPTATVRSTSPFGLSSNAYSVVDLLRGLFVIFLPYLIFLLVRSIIWSVKTLKSKEK
jgi:hypothetical protein